MQEFLDRLLAGIRGSQMLRLLVLCFWVLLLKIPAGMVESLVHERQQRRDEAVAEVSSKWGQAQAIDGPALVIPFTRNWTETLTDGRQVVRTATSRAVFLPESLRVTGRIDSRERNRGIFSVPVYTLDLLLEGEFARPDFSLLGAEPASIDWEHAQLAVGIADVRAIQEESRVIWNGQSLPLLPGTGDFKAAAGGVHALAAVNPEQESISFRVPLLLNGSQSAWLTPSGKTTRVTLESNHPDPGFQGNWLPTSHSEGPEGFTADWTISWLGRNYPQAWQNNEVSATQLEQSRFGVQLVNPVDQYRMAGRSVKYSDLFILLTFASIWLMEVLGRIRVHGIQYLLLGAALCLFYLLELALSEHLGFPLAYLLASLSILGMVGGYALVMLRSPGRAGLLTAGVALLYAYLYVVLGNEDSALLVGSIGLFLVLGLVMVTTRRVDWSRGAAAPPAGPPR